MFLLFLGAKIHRKYQNYKIISKNYEHWRWCVQWSGYSNYHFFDRESVYDNRKDIGFKNFLSKHIQ